MSSVLESERVRELLVRAGLGGLPPRTVRAVLVLVALLVAVGVWRFWPAAPEPEIPLKADEPEATAPAKESEPADVVVHVAGAVLSPGVYRLPAGSRVDDAISAAGGGAGNAAVDGLNRARILADGEQVYVPTAEEVAAGVSPPSASPGAAPTTSGGKIDINRATAAELEGLPGVGPATAQKIVEDRESNGPFAKPEDLMRVPGIGAKKFESMREYVACG